MTSYEWIRARAERLLPVLHGQVRRDLAALIERSPPASPRILDVGGRRSPYTVGLPALITILDLPSHDSNHDLGLTRATVKQLRRRRSNIEGIVVEDVLECSLPEQSFDGVVCVEVIEHVKEDRRFLVAVGRVLKPGGWAYFTTPNGDYIKNEPPDFNPDHVRHYRNAELRELLETQLEEVDVRYGVQTGRNRLRGLRSLELRHPFQSLVTLGSNVLNWRESSGVERQSRRTAHLLAHGWKRSEKGGSGTDLAELHREPGEPL